MKTLRVESPAFSNEGLIPLRHTGYGEDLSPELRLYEIDGRAKSLAVIMNDMGHPIPAYNHWVIWNLPVMSVIPEGIPGGGTVDGLSGAVQGRGYGRHVYAGPKPPFRWSHRYRFTVYVLDCLLELPAASRKRDLLGAMEGHILQEGALVGHYR